MRSPSQCIRCGRTLVFRDRSACSRCVRAMRGDVERFVPLARALLGAPDLDDRRLRDLLADLASRDVPAGYALAAVGTEAGMHLRRFVTTALADDVTRETVDDLRARAAALEVPEPVTTELLARLERGLRLTEVRHGHLPTAPPSGAILDWDEHCHLHVPCHYEKQLARRVSSVAGDLLLTNHKLRFVGHGDGWELPWHKILDVGADDDRAIEVVATQKRGTGRYHLRGDAEYVAEVGRTLVRMAKRHLVGRPGTIDTAAVPQNVKNAVWQRDGGRCRECGAQSYLEFDHVIPRSRGGATSVGNLQLLCRRCNLRKGDRL